MNTASVAYLNYNEKNLPPICLSNPSPNQFVRDSILFVSVFSGINNTICPYTRSSNFINNGAAIMEEKDWNNMTKLDLMSQYKIDWNDNGALPIPLGLIQEMRDYLSLLKFEPELSPTTNQSIQFNYYRNDGSYLEFELLSDGIIVYNLDAVNNEEKYNIEKNIDKVNAIVEKFFEE